MIPRRAEMEKVVPSLKLKTSELYFKWFSNSDNCEAIRKLVQQITNGKVTGLTGVNEVSAYYKESKVRSKSPTIQSPPMSPVSRMPHSPKSPRRKFANKVIAQSAAASMSALNNIKSSSFSDMFSPKDQTQPEQLLNRSVNDAEGDGKFKIVNKKTEPVKVGLSNNQLLQSPQTVPNVDDSPIKRTKAAATNDSSNKMPERKLQSDFIKKPEVDVNASLDKALNKTPKASATTTITQQQQQPKVQIAKFYFPNGRPEERKEDQEILKAVSYEFSLSKDGKICKEDFDGVVKAVGLPKFWKNLLFRNCASNSKNDFVTLSMFEQFWKRISSVFFNRPTLFVKLAANGHHQYLLYEDWEPLIQVKCKACLRLSELSSGLF